MKKNVLVIITLMATICAFGQGEVEAFRFSQTDIVGTARGQAMGGAFGALGGDATGVAINPAGISVYRSSEFALNAALTFNNSTSTWGDITEKNMKTSFSLDNISYVAAHVLGSNGNTVNFGFNFNRLKNFDRRYTASATGMNSSLSDYIAETTNTFGVPYSFWYNNSNHYATAGSPPWLTILGWDGYLIDKATTSERGNDYYSALEGRPDADLKVHERGGISSYDFTFGFSAGSFFSLGATLALTDISYTLSGGSEYNEYFANGDDFMLENFLTTEGTGLQVKVGVIIRPIDPLRLGLSYHSPTWYSMTDYFGAGVLPPAGRFENGVEAGYTSTPDDRYSYRFRTPGLFTASAAYIVGNNAIISVDYEIKNYSSARFADTGGYEDAFENSNRFVQEDYRQVSALRTGLEYRFTPQFSGRLGYAWQQAPYVAEVAAGNRETVTAGTLPHYTIDGDAHYLTAGLGYRFTRTFSVDLAVVNRNQQNELYFYSPIFDSKGNTVVPSYPAGLKNNSTKVLLTFGYKF
jgi:long-subunit fatty acid transport protein